ncbi:putative multidrug resistance ABC transporter ATP-binding/permease protein YheI [Geobacillus sp. BCO2]|nr:putative multidrug resistance ABC transporter ATP-binding/permease protein YheI [Geobacillus sp. BCO2]
MRVFRDLFWFFRQEKKAYITGIFVLVIVAFLETVPPKVIGLLVDHMKNGTMTKEVLIRWIAVLAAVAAALYGLRYAWRIFIFGSAVKLARQLRNELYQHFTNMSPSFYQRKRIGDLMAHATNDLQAIQQTAGSGILTLVDSVTLGGFVLATMAFSISWKLTLISLLPMPVMAAATSRYGMMLHRRFLTAQEAFSSLNDKVQESISGIRVIKAFGYEKQDVEAFRRQSEDVVAKNIAVAKIDALFDPTIGLLVGLSFFLAVAFGSQMVLAGELTIGELVSFTTYLGLLIWPMLAFGWLFNIVERGRASYDRVRALLAERDEIVERLMPWMFRQKGTLNTVFAGSSIRERQSRARGHSFSLERGATLGVVGKQGRAKRRCFACCCASLTAMTARFASAAATSAIIRFSRSVRRSATCRKTISCFLPLSATTSPLPSRKPERTRSSGRRGWPTSMRTFCSFPTGMRQSSASAEFPYPAGKNSGCPSPGRFSLTQKCSFLMTRCRLWMRRPRRGF